MRCPKGHGECQQDRPKFGPKSGRPYWNCTQCSFFEWLDAAPMPLRAEPASPPQASVRRVPRVTPKRSRVAQPPVSSTPPKRPKPHSAPIQPHTCPLHHCQMKGPVTVRKGHAHNRGRQFYSCPQQTPKSCGQDGPMGLVGFEWADGTVAFSEQSCRRAEQFHGLQEGSVVVARVSHRSSLFPFQGNVPPKPAASPHRRDDVPHTTAPRQRVPLCPSNNVIDLVSSSEDNDEDADGEEEETASDAEPEEPQHKCHVCGQLEDEFMLQAKGRCFNCDVDNLGDTVSYARNPGKVFLRQWIENGQEYVSFGKHSHQTFHHVYETDPGYCSWACKLSDPSGPVGEFVAWLKLQK